MLLEFNVSNFLSFNDLQSLMMAHNGPQDLAKHTSNVHGTSILKGSFIYGPNAAGKSNLVKAMSYSQDFILNKITSWKDLSHKNGSGASPNDASYFEYLLDVNDESYIFGMEVVTSTGMITSEWMYGIENGSEVLIYSLELKNNKKELISQDEKLQKLLETFTSDQPKGTFLNYAVSTNLSDRRLKTVFTWFNEKLLVKSSEPRDQIFNVTDEQVNRVLFYLKRLDTGIKGYDTRDIAGCISERQFYTGSTDGGDPNEKMIMFLTGNDGQHIRFPDVDSKFDPELIHNCEKSCKQGKTCLIFSNDAMILAKSEVGVIKYQSVSFKHGPNGFNVDYWNESQGTKRIIQLLFNYESSPLSTNTSDDNGCRDVTLVIDELECSIHTLATIELVKIFFNRPSTGRSQLIATTHESRLLSLENLMKDEIWFIESVHEGNDRSSRLYSLIEFDDPDEKSIDFAYIEGKYGAIPFVKYPKEVD